MPFYEREDKIISILSENEKASIESLAKKLFVSEPTMRRDLSRLAKKGVILRTHGGAMLKINPADEKIPLFLREQEHNIEKNKIARKAVSYIKDGDTIILDATTSAYHIVQFLVDFKDIIVITSGAKASFVLGRMGISNICTGGRMITKSLSYIGETAQNTVRSFNADVCFFSCRGLSLDGRLTDNSIEENDLRKAMMSRSAKKIFLCDNSKIGKSYLHNLCHISDVDAILCDMPLPESITDLISIRNIGKAENGAEQEEF